MSYIFEGLMRIVAAGIEGFIILINGLIASYNSVAWLYGGTIDYISNPAWDYANKIAADRKARQEARKKQQEVINSPSSSGTSQKVIESMTDTSKTTRADGSTVTTKVLTEKLQDETGKITQRVTKTVTEAGTKLVDGVERSYKTVTTYVDGIQTKVERSLDDIKASSSTTPTAPAPDKDLTDAVEANTEALLAANAKLCGRPARWCCLTTWPSAGLWPHPARHRWPQPPTSTTGRATPTSPRTFTARPRRRQTSSGKHAGKPTGPRPRNDERRAPQCHFAKTICSWSRMPGPLSTSGGTTARPTPSTPSTAWM